MTNNNSGDNMSDEYDEVVKDFVKSVEQYKGCYRLHLLNDDADAFPLVEVLVPPFEGVSFTYTDITTEEDKQSDHYEVISFRCHIFNLAEYTHDELNNSEEFNKLASNILSHIISVAICGDDGE